MLRSAHHRTRYVRATQLVSDTRHKVCVALCRLLLLVQAPPSARVQVARFIMSYSHAPSRNWDELYAAIGRRISRPEGASPPADHSVRRPTAPGPGVPASVTGWSRSTTSNLCIPRRYRRLPKPCDPAWSTAKRTLMTRFPSARILCLAGIQGVGKSFLGCHTLEALCRHRTGRYESGPRLLARGQLAGREGRPLPDAALLELCRDPEYLVLDDWPWWNSPRGGHGLLHDILEVRYWERRPTLIIIDAPTIRVLDALGPELAPVVEASGGIFSCEWEPFRRTPDLRRSSRGSLDRRRRRPTRRGGRR